MSMPDLRALIDTWRSDFEDVRFERARLDGEKRARNRLQQQLGRFSAADIEAFACECNQEFIPPATKRTATVNNRFSVGFKGRNVVLMKNDPAVFNHWVTQVFSCPFVDLAIVLDDFWKRKRVLGGGSLLPTMVLYLKGSGGEKRFYPWTNKLADVLGRAMKQTIGRRWSFENYSAYNEAADTFARQYDVPPLAVDFVLSRISRGEERERPRRRAGPA